MVTHKRLWIVTPLVIASLVGAWTCALRAQEASAPAPTPPAETATASAPVAKPAEIPDVADKALADLWRDFLHYISLASTDTARSFGQAIINKNPKPQDLYLLSVKFPDTQKRLNEGAAQSPDLKAIVEKVRAIIEQGYQADRSNPDQIARSIAELGLGMRQYESATARLVISGEFALPQMIQKLAATDTPNMLKERINNVLVRMGKDAVNGLSAALTTNDAQLQETLSADLAKIGYKHAAPYLKELASRKGIMDRTRSAVNAALTSLLGRDGAAKTVSELAYDLAQKYYARDESLMADSRLPDANVWYWQEGLGLIYKPVPRAVFADVYAMRLSKLALQFENKFDQAMALWLAADFRREALLPAGAKDATVPEGMPSARFFALASPPDILQEVLERGLKNKDTVVASGAIDALVRTQGAKSLAQPVAGGAQPLVEAMSYSEKEVRFSAALALANATPDRPFSGSDLVLTVLNEALRTHARKVALLVAADDKVRNETKDALRAAGFDVIDVSEPARAMDAAKGAAALDLAVLDGAGASYVAVAMRKDVAMVSVPVVVMSEDAKVVNQLKGDSLTTFQAAGQKLSDMLEKVFGKSASPESMPADRGDAWIIRIADSIRLLALTNNSVYSLPRVRPALIENLSIANVDVQIASAKALAAMSAAQAQQGIAELALKGGLADTLRVDMLNILTESVRKFGNQLNEQQVQALYGMVSAAGPTAVREAAAQAWGSLNLPSEKSKALILQFPSGP